MKDVLDMCCGGRMFRFNKKDPRVLYVDKRIFPKGGCKARPSFNVNPDIIADWHKLPFKDYEFKIVVFDPPHLIRAGDSGYMAQKYGKLPKDRKSYLNAGIKEGLRVLKKGGILAFKWNSDQIPLAEVLKCFEIKPSFGTRNGKGNKTSREFFIK